MKAQEKSPIHHVLDIQAATAALHRAAAIARKTAIDTNTPLVVMQNGKVTHIPAAQLRQQAQNVNDTPL